MNDARKLMIALAISVGVNLFLGGFVVARVVMRRHHMQHEHGFGPHPMAGPHAMFSDVDDPKLRAQMEHLLDARREAFERDRERMHKARQQVARTLEQEPFDAQALGAAFDELRNATTASQLALHQSLIEAAPKLSNEARRKLIKKWMRGPKHARGHQGDREDRD